MADDLAEYYTYLKKIKGLSDRSIYLYLKYYKHFKDLNINQRSINKFLSDRNNNCVCRSFLKSYLEFRKLEKEFDLPKVKTGATKKRLARSITKTEIDKLIRDAYANSVRHGLVIDIIYHGALRRAEPLTIKVNSFAWEKWFEDPTKFCVLNVIGKRDKERKVLVPPRVLLKILEVYLEKGILTPHMNPADIVTSLASKEDLLFNFKTEWNVWNIVKERAKKSLHRDIRTHEIRHARATELEEHGASIRDIQRYLGHASTQTTEIYLHSDEGKSLERIKTLSQSL